MGWRDKFRAAWEDFNRDEDPFAHIQRTQPPKPRTQLPEPTPLGQGITLTPPPKPRTPAPKPSGFLEEVKLTPPPQPSSLKGKKSDSAQPMGAVEDFSGRVGDVIIDIDDGYIH